MTPLPPLACLQAFKASARHLSFTRAGQELHLSPSAVSRQIAQLEDRADEQTGGMLEQLQAPRENTPEATLGDAGVAPCSAAGHVRRTLRPHPLHRAV
jgi:hypothetical protein